MNSSANDLALGIDVGGTKLLGVLLDGDGHVLRSLRAQTPTQSTDALLGALQNLVTALDAPLDTPVGIGLPGLVDRSGILRSSPHLGACVGLDLRGAFENRWVTVSNDADAALLAERDQGAARGVDEVLLLTIGTGIGGALVQGSQLSRGASGFAGEPGHLCVVPDGEPCACGQRGCLERYVSGPALARLGQRSGLGSDDLEGADVMAAAESGDERALAAVATMAAWLGRGLASMVTLLDPALILLGGGLGSASNLLVDGARGALGTFVMGAGSRPLPELRRTALGEQAGAVGMAIAARHP